MSSINRISDSLNNSYERLGSGKRINRAADDAAGLQIAEKTKTSINGYDVGANNMKTGNNLINTADSALDSLTGSLQRLRELAVAAQNTAIYGDDDIKAMQDEATQLLQGMDGVVDTATFNGKRLLDNNELNIQSSGNDSMKLNTYDSSVGSLGLSGLNIASNDALKKIDAAISSVSDNRSALGAKSNALSYAVDYNAGASQRLNEANSRIEDLDYAKEMSEKKKADALNEYSNLMQKKQLEQQENSTKRLLGL